MRVFSSSYVIDTADLTNGVLAQLTVAKFTKLISVHVSSKSNINQQLDVSISNMSSAASSGNAGTIFSLQGGTPGNTIAFGPFSSGGTVGSAAYREAANAMAGWVYNPDDDARAEANASSNVGVVLHDFADLNPGELVVDVVWGEHG